MRLISSLLLMFLSVFRVKLPRLRREIHAGMHGSAPQLRGAAQRARVYAAAMTFNCLYLKLLIFHNIAFF